MTKPPPKTPTTPCPTVASLTEIERAKLAGDFDKVERALRGLLVEHGRFITGTDCVYADTIAWLCSGARKTVYNWQSEHAAPSGSFKVRKRRLFPVRAVAEWIVVTRFPLGQFIVAQRGNPK